jgi:hypothetical protein
MTINENIDLFDLLRACNASISTFRMIQFETMKRSHNDIDSATLKNGFGPFICLWIHIYNANPSASLFPSFHEQHGHPHR